MFISDAVPLQLPQALCVCEKGSLQKSWHPDLKRRRRAGSLQFWYRKGLRLRFWLHRHPKMVGKYPPFSRALKLNSIDSSPTWMRGVPEQKSKTKRHVRRQYRVSRPASPRQLLCFAVRRLLFLIGDFSTLAIELNGPMVKPKSGALMWVMLCRSLPPSFSAL